MPTWTLRHVSEIYHTPILDLVFRAGRRSARQRCRFRRMFYRAALRLRLGLRGRIGRVFARRVGRLAAAKHRTPWIVVIRTGRSRNTLGRGLGCGG